jgi:hypothetical protein
MSASTYTFFLQNYVRSIFLRLIYPVVLLLSVFKYGKIKKLLPAVKIQIGGCIQDGVKTFFMSTKQCYS